MRYAQNENGQPVNIKDEHEQVIDDEGTKQPMALAFWDDEVIKDIFGYFPLVESTVKPDQYQDVVRSWVFDGDNFNEVVVLVDKPNKDDIVLAEKRDLALEAEMYKLVDEGTTPESVDYKTAKDLKDLKDK